MRLLAAVALLGAPAIASADPTRNIELGAFDPTPATSAVPVQLQTAEVGASGDYAFQAAMSFASNPLVLDTGAQDPDTVVRSQGMMSIGGAYAFADRFEAGAHMPFYVQSGEAVQMGTLGVPPASGAARGALTIHGKARFAGAKNYAFGAALSLRLPTMSNEQFAGADKPSGRVLLLGSAKVGERLGFYANLGGVIRATTSFANTDQKSGLAWGVGGSVRLFDPLTFTAELFGDVIPSGYHSEPASGSTVGTTSTLSLVEALAGLRVQPTDPLTITLAAGRGLTTAIGSPDFRAVLTIAFVPNAPHPPTLHHVVVRKPIEIPIDPRYKDDRDYDHIANEVDKCPDQPEDKDGFQDEDGCPDPDNDNDGIPDEKDKCPNEAEDKDGFQDDDGCPDPDNDHDGIPDEKDKCPTQAETINGVDDDDGCPDKGGDALVVSSPERLELLDPIVFKGAAIAPQSLNVLGQLAATLRARADILRIRLTVHVQPTASADKDQVLSDKRANAVRDWLVQWGIAEKRMEVKGFGGTKPLVPPNQKGAAAVNDRVDVIILELDRGQRKGH